MDKHVPNQWENTEGENIFRQYGARVCREKKARFDTLVDYSSLQQLEVPMKLRS